MKNAGRISCVWRGVLLAALALGAAPARAIMNGQGQDIFPVAAVFQSSATVLDARGLLSPSVNLAPGVAVSSEASAAMGAGVKVSSNVYIVGFSSAAKYYGDGSGLTNVGGGTAVPPGAVWFFNLAVCPAGWSELVGARGRYLVGLPSGGSLAGTAGTALADLENRPVGIHSHSITDPAHAHWNTASGGTTNLGYKELVVQDQDWNQAPGNPATTGISINNSGTVAGTNAPYLQLLVCQKD